MRRVIGWYGTNLDAGRGPRRWAKWRPTLSLCQHEDLLIDRLDLLVSEPSAADQLVHDISEISPDTKVVQHLVPLKDAWDFEEVYAAMYDFAHSCSFDEDDTIWVHLTTGTHVAQICWFLLTEARVVPGALLQTSPPRKNSRFASYDVIDLDVSRYDQIASRHLQERTRATGVLKSGIETKNKRFNSLIDRIEFVAGVSVDPMLLTGPTGAGKSHLARKVYELKLQRKQIKGAMVEVNCATLRGDSAMSALFGHKKGSFTGAVSDRPGLLVAAHEGLLFLDEIGELGLDEQAMLLRAIEDKRFLPVGSEREVHSDFQLIVGTNRDLPAFVRQGRFREDLLARIDLWHFALPGLKDRREDIPPNVDFELERLGIKLGRRVRFTVEARRSFLKFATASSATWRGNFRDLGAAITRLATLSRGRAIPLELVKEECERLSHRWKSLDGDAPASSSAGLVLKILGTRALELDAFDRVQLEEVLRVCGVARSASDAGRTLFAVSRLRRKSSNDADRLRKYLAKFKLDFAGVKAALVES